MPFGVGCRTHAEVLGVPFHLPCCELNRDQSAHGLRAVKIVADQHCPAETVGESAFEVNLLCGDSAALRFQTNESAANTKRATIHIRVARDRRESLRGAFDNFLVAPEELTRLRIDSDDAFAQKLYVLFAPTRLHDDRRRVTCRVATRNRRFPDERTRLFVERHYRRLLAAWCDDEDVAINQWRLCVGPVVRLAAEVFAKTFLPLNLAVLRVETNEVAIRPKRVEEISVDGRRGAGLRVRRILIRVADVPDARGPNDFSVLS